jgi:hypothetical protein
MSRIVTFSDSFVSAQEPSIEGVSQENYEIENNVIDEALFSIDSSIYKSAFIKFELIRQSDLGSYLESGELQLIYADNEWKIAKNIAINDELIVFDQVEQPQQIKLSLVTNAGIGSLLYTSGDMEGEYQGSLRLSITRITIL